MEGSLGSNLVPPPAQSRVSNLRPDQVDQVLSSLALKTSEGGDCATLSSPRQSWIALGDGRVWPARQGGWGRCSGVNRGDMPRACSLPIVRCGIRLPSPLCFIVSSVSQGHSQNPTRVEPCLTDCLVPGRAEGASSPTTAPAGHCVVAGHLQGAVQQEHWSKLP